MANEEKKKRGAKFGHIVSAATRALISKRTKEAMWDPKIRERHMAAHSSNEFKELMSKVAGDNLREQAKKTGEFRKDKTMEEIYGSEHAEDIKEKMADAKYANPTRYWLGKERSQAVKNALSQSKKGKTWEEIMGPDEAERQREIHLHVVFPRKDTSIEKKIQEQLTEADIAYEKHKPIFGKPDLFIPSHDEKYHKGIAIFCDGDYWHSSQKMQERDKLVTKTLFNKGYYVVRLPENHIREKDFNIMKYVDEITPTKKKKMLA